MPTRAGLPWDAWAKSLMMAVQARS